MANPTLKKDKCKNESERIRGSFMIQNHLIFAEHNR